MSYKVIGGLSGVMNQGGPSSQEVEVRVEIPHLTTLIEKLDLLVSQPQERVSVELPRVEPIVNIEIPPYPSYPNPVIQVSTEAPAVSLNNYIFSKDEKMYILLGIYAQLVLSLVSALMQLGDKL